MADAAKDLRDLLESTDAAGLVEVGLEATQLLGGARGMAKILVGMMLDPNLSGASRARVYNLLLKLMIEVHKIRGDRDQVALMPVEQIEQELLLLVLKYDGKLPLPGSRARLVVVHDPEPQAAPDQEPGRPAAAAGPQQA